jgi:hypothetical protein
MLEISLKETISLHKQFGTLEKFLVVGEESNLSPSFRISTL